MNERNILSECHGNFIINIKAAFQDRDTVYLLLDLLTGGDLRFHLCYHRRFNEEQTKMFAACIILGFKSIHGKNFIHRDIKPENIVFDEKGFLSITDFGIARKFSPDNAKETSGTPGYMAPEVMCRMNHSYEVDYYALGVICYEAMLGRRPYNGKSRKEIREQILSKQVLIKPEEVPKGWSEAGVDFINALIQRKPSKRLGFNGIQELVNHPWFAGFDWQTLNDKKIKPSFVPNVKNVFDYLKSITEDDSDAEDMAEQEINVRRKSVQELFNGYELAPRKEKVPTVSFTRGQSTKERFETRNESTRESWHTDRMKKTSSSNQPSSNLSSYKYKASPNTNNYASPGRVVFKWRSHSKNI